RSASGERAGRRAGWEWSSGFATHADPFAQQHSGGSAEGRCRDDRLDRGDRFGSGPSNSDHAAGRSGRDPDCVAKSKRIHAAFAVVAERLPWRRSRAAVNKSLSMFSMNVICLERTRCVLKYLSVLISANRISANLILTILIPATLIGPSAPAWAQSPAQSSAPSSTTTGTLRGQVTDPSGAVVPSATVAVLVSGGQSHSATTNR